MDNNKPTIQPTKLKVKDAHLDDSKIPRNLILMYGETPYIQKAGLEWKANRLFGGAGYSIKTEFVERDFKNKYYLVKAILTVLDNGAVFENYGEAYPDNANSMMQKNLLHLAITRAECRVLRMATACGYASYDEVKTMPNGEVKEVAAIAESPDDNEPATDAQKATVDALARKNGIKADSSKMTKGTARAFIAGVNAK